MNYIMRKVIMTKEVVDRVLSYLQEGKTVPEISILLGINKVTISSYLRTHGIKLNPDKGNVHYFENNQYKEYNVSLIENIV